MSNAKRDENGVPTLLAVSTADSLTPVAIEADPTNKAILVTNIPSNYELAKYFTH